MDMFALIPKPVRRVCAVCTAVPAAEMLTVATRRLFGSNQRFLSESIPSGLKEHLKTQA